MVKRGYSLAETLIVIALIMIMAGLFLNSDLPRRKLTIQREAYILSQNIRTMENNAGNARSNTNCNVPNPNSPNPEGGLYPFDGYAIMLEIEKPQQYFLYTNCNEYGRYLPCSGGGYESDLRVGDCIQLNSTDREGSFLFNAADISKCIDKPTCDYYNDNRGGDGYINELMQKRIFPTSIKLNKLEAYIRDNDGQWKWESNCDQLIIDFKPTNPETFIICRTKDNSSYYYVAREAKISITDGENTRLVQINKAGLVAVKSDTQ